MYLVTAEEMRAFDAAAIEEYGIPGVVLMENAGRTTFHILKTHLGGDVRDLKVSIVAGPGNNGGDGYVIARYLINHGADVHTFLLGAREKIKGDALINLHVLERMSTQVHEVTDEDTFKQATRRWRQSDVIVDAMLGTGLDSEVRSPYREAIAEINRVNGLRLAVDMPSGLDADTGRILGSAIHADITVTYGFKKLGMALYPGLECCGKVEVVDISIPLHAIEKSPPRAWLYNKPDAVEFWRLRADPQGHKGIFGHLLIVGGSPGKTGAPAMAARAASRMGAGLVTVGVPASLNSILETKLTEEMSEPLPESVAGYLGSAAVDRVLALAEGKRCVVLGPGLSTVEGIAELVNKLLEVYQRRLVIDADGLNVLAPNLDVLRETKARVIMTPHPGEMARLTGKTVREVQQDRLGFAKTFAADYGIWLILKGARTLIASPDGRIIVNTTGTPWMASGGQGDVLSGILGGLLVQGIPPEEALPFGVYLHGLAADNLVERLGPGPVIATDVIEELPKTISAGREEA